METAKANILNALIKEHEDKGKLFYDFRLELQEGSSEERAIQSLIYAFNAWSGNQWRINDSFSDIICEAKKAQRKIKECKEVSNRWGTQTNILEYVARAKEIENGIWQLCLVIGLSQTTTMELFKKVSSFIDFDSFI